MSSVLNTGNWYEPVHPAVAGILLLLSILVEVPLVVACLSGEKGEWRDLKLSLAVVLANVVSFCLGFFMLELGWL